MSTSEDEQLTFQELHSLEDRIKQSQNAISKYPGRVPCIAEPLKTKVKWTDKVNMAPLSKQKFLVPGDFTVAQFMYSVRKRIELESDESLFFYVNGTLVPMSSRMDVVYEQYADEDGFVYFNYCAESVFG
eukprot:TRINITY_DN202_c0_g1_i1.p1 TRINITY_DN202_c0_g1~~TRINITY_DN202_c0_g1_i1.p1  ORF type:complete len:130 (+),score=32.75 TRINITY_DN202_c0_g1_i1:22-411(+)